MDRPTNRGCLRYRGWDSPRHRFDFDAVKMSFNLLVWLGFHFGNPQVNVGPISFYSAPAATSQFLAMPEDCRYSYHETWEVHLCEPYRWDYIRPGLWHDVGIE